MEARSPDSHLLPRQETFSNKKLREAPEVLSEAGLQTSSFVSKTMVALGVWEGYMHFIMDSKCRQASRRSEKGNESILMSGLEVSPPSLPQDFEPCSSKPQSDAAVVFGLVKGEVPELLVQQRSQLAGGTDVLSN